MSTITVLIPAHNEQASIASTIRTVLGQSRQPDKIIVVSDNSTDLTTSVAADMGVTVMETVGNTARKAGALNQAIAKVYTDFVMVLDADTEISPTFIEQGMALLDKDKSVGAAGGVFSGVDPQNLLEEFQANEYERYGVQIDLTDRTSVLTGTAAIIRKTALDEVADSRGTRLPSIKGDYYDRNAITEDSEMTLALKTLDWKLKSPVSMSCTTELMPTWGDLHRQRVRWYKGMLDNLAAYGFTSTTARYFGQQAMLFLGVIFMSLLTVLTFVTVVTGQFSIVPLWLIVGGVFLVERLVTVWRRGVKARVIAAVIFPEMVYDFALQIALAKAVILFLTKKDTSWNHVVLREV